MPARSSNAVTELRGQPRPGRWRSNVRQSDCEILPRWTSAITLVSKMGMGRTGLPLRR